MKNTHNTPPHPRRDCWNLKPIEIVWQKIKWPGKTNVEISGCGKGNHSTYRTVFVKTLDYNMGLRSTYTLLIEYFITWLGNSDYSVK